MSLRIVPGAPPSELRMRSYSWRRQRRDTRRPMGTTWRYRLFTSGKMPPTLATTAVSCASAGLCLATDNHRQRVRINRSHVRHRRVDRAVDRPAGLAASDRNSTGTAGEPTDPQTRQTSPGQADSGLSAKFCSVRPQTPTRSRSNRCRRSSVTRSAARSPQTTIPSRA